MNAPATSPLAEVDINNVVELLVELTRPSALIKPSSNTGVRHNPGPSRTGSLRLYLCLPTGRSAQTFRFTGGHILK